MRVSVPGSSHFESVSFRVYFVATGQAFPDAFQLPAHSGRSGMPQYQLPTAAILAATGVGSILVLYLTSSRQRKIQLPTSGEHNESLLRDPFDVTRPEDFIDGHPINEVAFWNKAGTTRTISLSFLLISTLMS
jgi:hypothetical protein